MSVARMLRVDVVAYHRDVDEVMEALQGAGVVHVTPTPESSDPSARPPGGRDALDRYNRLEHAVHALRSVAPATARLQETRLSPEETLDEVDSLIAQRDALRAELAMIDNQLATLRPWGEFSPADVEAIRDAGVSVVFAELNVEEWDRIKPQVGLYEIAGERDGRVNVLLLDVDATALGVSSVNLPAFSLSQLQEKHDDIHRAILRCNIALGRFSHFAPMLTAMMEALEDQVHLIRARDLGHMDGPLVALHGYVPARRLFELQAALEPVTVAVSATDPDERERVPVLLRNNWFSRGFEAVLKAFSGVHYREKDISWVVGILFIVFGSLCLLDAGYGLLLLITGLMLRSRGNEAFFRVFALTGFFATIVGLVGGQIFGLVVGQHILKELTPPIPLVTDPLSCFIFSLIVGGFAMAFSYSVAIWQKGVRTAALGSLLLVLALGTLVVSRVGSQAIGHLFTGGRMPEAEVVALVQLGLTALGAAIVAAAVVAWVIFPDPVFGAEARAGNVIWTLYSGFTGLLQDILSHMRLFGIALSGSILALVVNDIGKMLPLPGLVVFAVIGHVFVYVLALLSLYIHTNRLIFLEFGSKCIEGGNFYYAPLRRGSST